MEGQFNNKPIKPTLDTPTPKGKQVDTYFKKEIRKSGMNLNEEEAKKKHSLKKKIFKLDKMETLVHSDEFLSQKFNEMKGDDPEVIWGYHWNEVILNALFNDYILNSPQYLQKYKNTRAQQKTRRGEEGIKQLQNDLEKEKAASSSAEERKEDLMGGEENQSEDKEKVDELFGFGKDMSNELPMNKRSKNDTYLVDMAKKRLVAPVSYNSTPEEKQAILTKYLGQNPNIKQISWYNAVKQGIQGVPTQVSDGSIEQMDAEMAKKYPQGSANMVSLAEDKVDETTGAASAGAFSPALDKQEVSETTTSASSGQYSGKAIWSKNGKPAANKPAWKGGEIVAESVINGDKTYLTEASAFRNYILKNEIVDMLNECEEIEEAETFQQHSGRLLAKLNQYADENPELKNDNDFQELVNITTQRAGQNQQSSVATQPQKQSSVATLPTQSNVSEHHLHSVEDKIVFIVQNNPNYTMDQLSVMPADEIEELYIETENKSGVTENSDFKQAMVKDLKYTGNQVRDNESTDSLESKDGLFKDKWNTNENKLKENKETMSINKEAYKSYLKKRITESANTFKTLNESEKKVMLEVFHEDYLTESMIDNQPDSMVNNQESSMIKSMDTDELNTDGQPIPNGVSGLSPQGQTEGYDVDDVKAKGHLADKLADYSDEEPTATDAVTEPVAQASPEKANTAFGGDRESPETISDAEKFRQMLKAKYGVDDVSSLSPLQRQELTKAMNFGTTTPEKSAVDMDFSKFSTTDADRAAYKERDNKRLGFLAQHANQVADLKGYYNLANQFKADTGENMFHPMAILASIEQMPKDSVMRSKLSNIENVLRTQLTQKIAESLNEDRKVPSILNVEKLGAENVRNFKKDQTKEDGIDQDKTYPKDDGIHKAPVWPDPSKFYIEQDLEKIQRDAPTMESIEKAALAKSKGTLENIGNSTADGKHIPKRNLTKEEAYEVAMNRGDGMSDIVYDNKPSEKFEQRMKKDMGDDIYKVRQEKMAYRADAPMYNKDTQPTAAGDKKEENNKFKMGYNNEAITAKYKDEYGKLKLIEFVLADVEEVSLLSEEAIILSIDGLGNKYNLKNKRINENVGFDEIVAKFAFYLEENKVVAIEKTKVIVETKIQLKGGVNESYNKMKHLMNYKPNEYVDTKKSVKY